MRSMDEYIENIAFQEIFADGLMIADEKGIVRYMRQYRQDVNFFTPQEVVGKHILEIYTDVRPEDSTLLRALQGIPTISQLTTQVTFQGKTCLLLENTFPIKKNGKIIGAISFAKFANYLKQELSLPDASAPAEDRLFTLSDIIGESLPIERLREQIRQVARTGSTVLIYGETGTGKEMAAQSAHTASGRRRRPFLSQNCAAIPANLLESVLFGTVKGSYTGAVDRPGIFETANGGTIFLDEINSMSMDMQAKLLKVLEEKRVTRLGSSKKISIDVRIFSAMNEDPQICMAQGRMRSDLFYRLSTVIIEIPPLRERREDILLLTKNFIDYYNKEMNLRIEGLSPKAEALFLQYDWPGNVRELKNVVEGAFNFETEKVIQEARLPSYMVKAAERKASCPQRRPGDAGDEEKNENADFQEILSATSFAPLLFSNSATEKAAAAARAGTEGSFGERTLPEGRFEGQALTEELFGERTLTEAVESFEKQFILRQLAQCKNLSQLAKTLGISRQRLSYKLKKYGISL